MRTPTQTTVRTGLSLNGSEPHPVPAFHRGGAGRYQTMTNLLLHLAAAWQVGGDARPPDKDWAQAIGLSVPELVAMAGMAEGKVRSAVRRMVYGDYVWSYDGYAYHGRAAIYRLTVRGAAFVEFAARVGLVDSSWASAGLVKSVSRGVKDEQKMWEAPVRLRPEQLAQPWPV